MDGKCNIADYRDRMDTTLASRDLIDEETLKNLVANQIQQSLRCDAPQAQECFDTLVGKRTKELSSFLSMMRSVSSDEGKASPGGGWKIKVDNEEYRVMYREGPEGTPFHTLLLEGYVDGSVDDGLCIAWESGLYRQWWPQFSFPTFKVVASECLQKIRSGEQISLVRMKLPWPVSAREALVHYSEFEYYEDELIIVLLSSISDLDRIDRASHGFAREGIPDVQDVVRVDLVGGFAFKKLTAERSYFRMIMNLDIKLEYVPPTLINFVSRQVLGSGFKLFKKEIACVSNGQEDFSKALKEPLYTRIREAMYSKNISEGGLESEIVEKMITPTPTPSKGHRQHEETNIDKEAVINGTITINQKALNNEIKPMKGSEQLHKDGKELYDEHLQSSENITKCCVNDHKKATVISSEVGQALGTLEKMISALREYKYNETFTDEAIRSSYDHSAATRYSRHTEDCFCTETESKDNTAAAISEEEEETRSWCETPQTCLSLVGADNTRVLENSTNGDLVRGHNIALSKQKKNKKKWRFCCVFFTS